MNVPITNELWDYLLKHPRQFEWCKKSLKNNAKSNRIQQCHELSKIVENEEILLLPIDECPMFWTHHNTSHDSRILMHVIGAELPNSTVLTNRLHAIHQALTNPTPSIFNTKQSQEHMWRLVFKKQMLHEPVAVKIVSPDDKSVCQEATVLGLKCGRTPIEDDKRYVDFDKYCKLHAQKRHTLKLWKLKDDTSLE